MPSCHKVGELSSDEGLVPVVRAGSELGHLGAKPPAGVLRVLDPRLQLVPVNHDAAQRLVEEAVIGVDGVLADGEGLGDVVWDRVLRRELRRAKPVRSSVVLRDALRRRRARVVKVVGLRVLGDATGEVYGLGGVYGQTAIGKKGCAVLEE